MAEIWLQEWGDTSCHQNPTQGIRKQPLACFWEVGGALQGSIDCEGWYTENEVIPKRWGASGIELYE